MKTFSAFIVSIALLAAALVGYGALRVVLARKSTDVAALAAKIQARNDEASRVAAARSALAELASDEAAVQSYFVPQSGVVAFINDLESRGQALGAVVSITSVAAAGVAQHPALRLSADIAGPFDAVMRTIGSIEFAPYDLTVTNLSLIRGEKGQWTANLTISVGSTPGQSPSS